MDLTQILNQILGAAGVAGTSLPADIDLSLGNILRALFILALVYLLARLVRGIVPRALRSLKLEPRVEHFIIQGAYYGIITLGIIWVLGGFGLSVVILGVAVGFAFKDLIQNFAAGLLIMGTRPFQPGDWIVVSDKEGIVAQIGWRGTFIDTFDGRRVVVPNMNIMTNVVVNNSIHSQLRRTLNLSLSLDMDFASAEALILEALRDVQGISREPSPQVLLDSLSGDAMNLTVWIWILEPKRQFRTVPAYAQRAIKEHLQRNQVMLNPATTVVLSKGSDEILARR